MIIDISKTNKIILSKIANLHVTSVNWFKATHNVNFAEKTISSKKEKKEERADIFYFISFNHYQPPRFCEMCVWSETKINLPLGKETYFPTLDQSVLSSVPHTPFPFARGALLLFHDEKYRVLCAPLFRRS